MIKLEEIDRKILDVISNNARDTIVEIARKAGATPAIVTYRLNQLTRKGVIQSFRAKVNAEKMGYSLYKVDFSLEDLSKLPELEDFAETIPSLVYIDETIWRADFEADFHLKSQQELELVLKKFKDKFHSTIRETNYLVYSKVLKYAYFPS